MGESVNLPMRSMILNPKSSFVKASRIGISNPNNMSSFECLEYIFPHLIASIDKTTTLAAVLLSH
jgi:hypothetical protein